MKLTREGESLAIALESSGGKAAVLAFVNLSRWAPSADSSAASEISG